VPEERSATRIAQLLVNSESYLEDTDGSNPVKIWAVGYDIATALQNALYRAVDSDATATVVRKGPPAVVTFPADSGAVRKKSITAYTVTLSCAALKSGRTAWNPILYAFSGEKGVNRALSACVRETLGKVMNTKYSVNVKAGSPLGSGATDAGAARDWLPRAAITGSVVPREGGDAAKASARRGACTTSSAAPCGAWDVDRSRLASPVRAPTAVVVGTEAERDVGGCAGPSGSATGDRRTVPVQPAAQGIGPASGCRPATTAGVPTAASEASELPVPENATILHSGSSPEEAPAAEVGYLAPNRSSVGDASAGTGAPASVASGGNDTAPTKSCPSPKATPFHGVVASSAPSATYRQGLRVHPVLQCCCK